MPSVGSPHGSLSDSDRHLLGGWLQDFERSWHAGRLSARALELPPDGPLRVVALAEMVKLDLRCRWQQGRRVIVEAYLKRYPELGADEAVVLDLLAAEFQVRRRHGASARVEEYARRFPGQADALRQRLGQEPQEVPTPADSNATRATRSLRSDTHPVSQPSGAPTLPEQFGRYRIIKQVGKGGMGSVYLAHDTQLDRSVALKVPHFKEDDAPDVLERFTREARAAATIAHPNICPVYDVNEIDGIHYVTMAYVEGRPLSDLVERGKPLPPRSVAALVRKLALALQEAHRHGVIHRDLKPSNVMVNQRREPVIMDFGLARRMNQDDVRLTKNGAIMGTPAYMAPEQVSGDVAAMGPGCDIYSLGVILYELLTGQLPFQGPTTAVLAQILTQEPPRPSQLRPDLDPALDLICQKAMAKKAEERFRSMGEFATALGHCLKAERASQTPQAIPVGTAPAAPQAIPLEPPAAATESAEPGGGATELLARLVERIEAVPVRDPEAAAAAQRPRGVRRWLPLGAALVGLALVGTIVYMAVQVVNKPINVATTVSVQVEVPKAVQEAAVVLVLDGEVVSKEQLAKPVSLKTGEHELITKKGNEVVETRKFTVGRGDTTVNPFDSPDVAPSSEVQALIQALLKDEDKVVRYDAAESLQKLGATSAVPALCEALKDKTSLVRCGAATALGKLGATSAVPALIRALSDDLWDQGPGPGLIAVMVGQERDLRSWDANPERLSGKRAELDALRALAPERVHEALVGATNSKNAYVRGWAVRELGKEKDNKETDKKK